ncbi:hypothetical protein TD95_000269, partial [Thielaviopsis punctulata]
ILPAFIFSHQHRFCSSSSALASMSWNNGHVGVTSPDFTQLVVRGMRTMFPEKLADTAWDNVGLLLDNTKLKTGEGESGKQVVLVTNDLTYPVAEEAIKVGASVVISYHPIIFRGLKSITTADPQQATLLLLAKHNIAVYSPHTALDAAQNGINTWLLQAATGPLTASAISPLKPISPLPAGISYGGYGAGTTLPRPARAADLIVALGKSIGQRYVNVVAPTGCDLKAATVTSVAVCAGSGGDLLRGSAAELWITGEMSHHEALAAMQAGRIVVTAFHSNTERTFLREGLTPMLQEWLHGNGAAGAKVVFSGVDSDPYKVLDLKDVEQWV